MRYFSADNYDDGVVTGFFRWHEEGWQPISNAQWIQANKALEAGKILRVINRELVCADPDPVPVAELRDQKRTDINRTYETAIALFKSQYPPTEVLGWPEQAAALDLYDADSDAPNPLLAILADGNGVTVAEMAERIRAKRNLYLHVYARLTAKRHQLDNAVLAIDSDGGNARAALSVIDETQLLTLAAQLVDGGG